MYFATDLDSFTLKQFLRQKQVLQSTSWEYLIKWQNAEKYELCDWNFMGREVGLGQLQEIHIDANEYQNTNNKRELWKKEESNEKLK